MAFRVIVIPTDLALPVREETMEGGDKLAFLQGLVGGYVERVSSARLNGFAAKLVRVHPHSNRPAILVDENGLLKGRPVNMRASMFYGDGRGPYYLHGDAVVIWERGEDWVSLPIAIQPDDLASEIGRRLQWVDRWPEDPHQDLDLGLI